MAQRYLLTVQPYMFIRKGCLLSTLETRHDMVIDGGLTCSKARYTETQQQRLLYSMAAHLGTGFGLLRPRPSSCKP